MIVEDVSLEPHKVTKGDQRDPYTETEYYIKVLINSKWYVNKDKSYSLNEALVARDKELDGVRGRRS